MANAAKDAYIFSVLACEASPGEIPKSDAKIRRGLQRRKLGSWEQARVERLRALKDSVLAEVRLSGRSRYYVAPPGAREVSPGDWDLAALCKRASADFPDVAEIEEKVRLALHLGLYYLA